MFFLQKPKFPILRTLVDISQKKISRTNYFLRKLCFSPEIWHIRKSTKMGFPGNQPKMAQLHKNTTSWEMVVRGWYMTHFDRRDLLNSKKLVWDGFHNLPDLPGPICDFSRFFRKFRGGPRILENRFLNLSIKEKMFKNWFFQNVLKLSKNTILKLHFDMFTSVILPITQNPWGSEI